MNETKTEPSIGGGAQAFAPWLNACQVGARSIAPNTESGVKLMPAVVPGASEHQFWHTEESDANLQLIAGRLNASVIDR